MSLENFYFQNNNKHYYKGLEKSSSKTRKAKFFFWFFVTLIILGIAFLASVVLAYKFYSTSKKVIVENPPKSFLESVKDVSSRKQKPLRGESEGRINVLLLGLAGENYPGENLTDSIIIASLNPKTYQTALLSIPRDFYVQIPNTQSYTKINALYARGKDRHGKTAEGIEDLKKALTDITGLPLHYYIALDFDGFKKVIDELGGIKIQVPKDIHDERYPGLNYSYETFDIKEGLRTLDGETALKYARTRHDEDGDFGRAYRQQQILEAVRQKAFSIETLLNLPTINNILNILGDHLRTDIPLDEMESFLELAKKIDTHLTINKVLDAGKSDSLLAVSHTFLGHVRAFVLIPRTGKYNEIQELAQNIFSLELIERKKKEIKNEEAKITIINRSKSANLGKKIMKLLEKMGYTAQTATLSKKTNPKASPLESSTEETTIYDISKTKPFSLEDIAKKFSANISPNLPPDLSALCQKVDFCLAAGSDLIDSLDYEENTIEELEQGYDKQMVNEREYIELLKKGSNKKHN